MNNPQSGFLISSIAWQGVRHSEAIAAVREAGFGGVEILCKPGHFEHNNSIHITEVAAALSEWPDAVVTLHAPFHDVDLASPDTDERNGAVQESLQALRVALRLRAEVMTLHTRSKEKTYHWGLENATAFQHSLSELLPVATELKIRLAIENCYDFTADPENLVRLLGAFPAHLVGACLDTGHAHLGGRTVMLARLLAPRIFVVHLHDNAALGKDEHLIPGQGTIPWAELTEVLRAGIFAGRLVVEVLVVESLVNTLEIVKTAIVETGLWKLAGNKTGASRLTLKEEKCRSQY